MAFNPTSNPVIWLYEWYAGFTAALQTEVNKEYGYASYDDMKQEWGSFDIDIDGAQVMNSALSAFVGSPLANKIVPVKPITITTDDGPRAVIATGQMITAATGEAVRLKIDGFLTSIPWDTVVADVMLANNYEVMPNELYNLSSKIATEIVGHTVTDTSGLYVTGKICLDANGVARSYVDDYVVQGLVDGAAAADLLNKTELDDYEIDEPVPTLLAPDANQLAILIWQSATTGVAIMPPDWWDDYDFASITTQAKIQMAASMILSHWSLDDPAWFNVNSHAQLVDGEPRFVISVNRIPQGAIQAMKFTGHGLSANVNELRVQPVNSTDWLESTTYVTGASNYTIVIRPDGIGEVSGASTPFYGGYGFAYSDGSGTYTINKATASNMLSQTVVAPEIDIHDIDTWGPTQEGHAIDELWPGWMAGALIGAGAIDVDSDVWFPTKNIPLGIDQTDVADPAQTISKPLDVAQAGAIAGAEAGAISLTDTIADAITIPSIYNPAIAIPATTSPTPTPTPVIPVLPPSISAQRLYTVHQVSQAQINALGAYLWSSDFISLIEHMFTEPIDAVIGLHTLFYGGSLPAGSTETIKLGAIEATGCTGQLITNQFMKFQCGSVNIPEYWNNANDYAPYTEAEIFLPFIGFRDLDINEIMGGAVSLSYGIDIFTGACVAMIGVMRDHISQALYTFEGNCAIQQPVTGADYSRIIGGLISAGMGIAAGGAGAVIGTAAALSSHKISYGRSGNISANAGACMPKQPYILIKRPNAYDAPNYRSFYGDPANWTVTLGSCSGYTRVKDVHLDQIACTDVEKDEILSMLKAGVIL